MENSETGENPLPPAFDLETIKPRLESMALSVYIDLMNSEKVDPTTRKAAADSVMRMIGKDAPPKVVGKDNPNQTAIIMQFGGALKDSLSGIALLTKDVTPKPDDLTGGLSTEEQS